VDFSSKTLLNAVIGPHNLGDIGLFKHNGLKKLGSWMVRMERAVLGVMPILGCNN
jgi:hypothetical protein